jgi:hypothetical protein
MAEPVETGARTQGEPESLAIQWQSSTPNGGGTPVGLVALAVIGAQARVAVIPPSTGTTAPVI